MISLFVTVGAQLPFDRLIKAVDEMISKNSSISAFSQIGQSEYVPRFMSSKKFLGVSEYSKALEQSDVVISHAGMGTIIQCMDLKKRLLIVPRLYKYGEHRNDHQLGTSDQFSKVTDESTFLQVCNDIKDLEKKIRSLALLSEDSSFLNGGRDNSCLSLSNSVERLIINGT